MACGVEINFRCGWVRLGAALRKSKNSHFCLSIFQKFDSEKNSLYAVTFFIICHNTIVSGANTTKSSLTLCHLIIPLNSEMNK